MFHEFKPCIRDAYSEFVKASSHLNKVYTGFTASWPELVENPFGYIQGYPADEFLVPIIIQINS